MPRSWAAKPPVEADHGSLVAESAASPQSKNFHVSSLPMVAPKEGSGLDRTAQSVARDPENALEPSKEINLIQSLQSPKQSMQRKGRQQKRPSSQDEQRAPFRSAQTRMTPEQKQPAQHAKAMGLENPFRHFTYSDAGKSRPGARQIHVSISLHLRAAPFAWNQSTKLAAECHTFADLAVQKDTLLSMSISHPIAGSGDASRRTALASTPRQKSPTAEPVQEIIRFKARKLKGVYQLS